MARAQDKLNKQSDPRRKVDLQLTLDHFLQSRSRFVIEEQTKIVAMALRVENRCHEHSLFTTHRKEMLKLIERTKLFESGSSAI
jgi:hypothetical protein